MQYSVVNKSVLNGDFRIDPEFYKKDYLKNDVLLKQRKILDMDKVFITDGEHGTPEYDKTTNIKYITAENIKEGYIQETDFNTISKEQDERNKRAHVQVDDILIYSVGAYAGLVAKAEPHLFPCSIPRSVAIMRLAQKEISDFIVIFLNSKYGKYQTSRLQAGNAQPVLALEKIKELNIPLLSKALVTKVRKINKLAYISRLRAKKQYKTSEKVLLQSLDMLNFQCSQCKSYIKNFSDVQSANRLDAEYFQPKYDELIDKIKSYPHGWDTLGKQFNQNNLSFTINENTLYNYVEISSVDVSSGKITSDAIIGKDLPANAKIKLQRDDVLISKVRPYRGAIALVEDDNLIGSGAFTVLHEKTEPKINKETLYTFLRLKSILDLTLKYNTGTSYPTITDNDVLNLPIPLFEEDIQKQVKVYINSAKELQKQSKQLLEIAKHGVEKAIEENEETATQWIDEQLNQIGVTL